MSDEWELVFGYRHVVEVPRCPCGDPGDYLMMEQAKGNPLKFRLQCWCGRTIDGQFGDMAERAEFLAKNGETV
jgi:hypothetical protein